MDEANDSTGIRLIYACRALETGKPKLDSVNLILFNASSL